MALVFTSTFFLCFFAFIFHFRTRSAPFGLPMPFTVSVLKQGCCKDLNQALVIACCLRNDEYLFLAEVYEHRIYQYLEDPSEPLATIKDDEHIVAYIPHKKETDFTSSEICHRYQEKSAFILVGKLTWVLQTCWKIFIIVVSCGLRFYSFIADILNFESLLYSNQMFWLSCLSVKLYF